MKTIVGIIVLALAAAPGLVPATERSPFEKSPPALSTVVCYTCFHMLIRIRKLVLYLLLACLPLQSMAGPAHMLLCDDATPAAANGLHVHDDGDEHPAHAALADQSGASSHDCCQQYFPGVLDSSSLVAGATRIVSVPVAPASFYSFFPERLKRPPLSVLAV